MLDRFLPSTLRWRLAATYAVLVIVLMASFGYFLVGEVRHLYQDRIGDQLVAQTQLVSAVVQPMLASGATDAELDAEIKRLAAEISPSIEVIDATGRVAADSTVDPASVPNAQRSHRRFRRFFAHGRANGGDQRLERAGGDTACAGFGRDGGAGRDADRQSR